MAGNWKQMAGAVSLLAFLTGTSAALAQERRPWVDPPSENGGPVQSTPPAPTPAPPQANAPEPRPEPVMESAQAKGPSSPSEKTSAENTRSKRKIATQQQPRKTSSKAAASVKQKTAFSTRKEAAIERRSNNKIRSTRVREAVNSGLEVMSLRTIEFPDGRRIEVLVRPSPGTLSRLMDEP